MRALTRIFALIASVVVAAAASAQPQYQIYDLGVTHVSDPTSQSFGVSSAGIAVGRSVTSNSASQAFTWALGVGLVALPNLAGRNHAVANDANDSGIVVGTAATTLFGSSRLPVVWTNGAVSQLPLPAGETLGDANGVNASGVAVGSVDGGSLQQAVIYNGGTATVITQTTPTGCFFVTAFGINNSGRIVGQGIDPNDAARNVGIVYDIGSGSAFEVGAIPGANGALAFGVGNGGHVVGSSMMNQGSGTPFIWSQANGIAAIPLATGTSEGSAKGVNSAGWVVGTDSSAFAIPFFWDGTTTYRLADLLPPGSGWDLDTNTFSSALAISDNGVIVGSGVHNGDIHAYAMVPVAATPTPSPAGTPDPSPPPTCTPVPVFIEDFDRVTAPALPAGWITTFVPGAANCTPAGTCAFGTNWATSATNPSTPPNCAFHDAPGCVTDSILDTPSFVSGTLSTEVAFRHSYDLENGLDGAVMEISINGGAFTDIIAAGGQFMNPGSYNGTISAGSLSPIAGRQAWTGNSGGYITTTVRMPSSALFQPVRLRFRLATDCSGAGTGWRIDHIKATYPTGCPSPVPSPTPITPTPTATPTSPTPTPSPTLTPPPTPTPPPTTPTPTPSATAKPTPSDTIPPSPTPFLTPTPPPTATPTPPPTPTPTPTPTPVAQALNLSTRMCVQTGENVAIGGFIITGTAPKHVLLRAIGPSLSPGVPNVLADPVMELHGPGAFVPIINDNWRDDPAQEALIIASGIPPTNNLESAIDATLISGSYTAIVSGKDNTSGIGLVEAYDLSQAADSKLANISTRAFVETGDNAVIAGFILGGSNGNDRVVVRGIGPSLTAAGVADALADPTLELRDGDGVLLASNNDWQDDPTQAAELIAAGLAPTNALEAGIAATLPPGPFTALLAGLNNGTGVGLVEVYDRGAP